MALSNPAAKLCHWILTDGRRCDSVLELMGGLAAQMRAYLRVDRVWTGTRLLHPQTAAYVWIWEDGQPDVERKLTYIRFAMVRQRDSPVLRLEHGEPRVRFSLAGDQGLELPDVCALWDRNYTDLYGLPFTMRGEWAGGFTWATRAPGGFDDTAIAIFDAIQPALSAVVESLARDLVMAALLRTYLGRDAGDRVVHGQVQRGDSQSLRAVVWFSDLRGFTRLSVQLGRARTLALLNDVFEVMVRVIESEGGQVLKFMGDGVLGVFTAAPSDPSGRAACRAARRAASSLRAELSALSERREAAGLTTPEVGLGLHFGDVSYGNIGAPGRLDFTVIGSAVNLASRIQDLCKPLGQPVLASAEVAAGEGGAWSSAGAQALRGVAEPVELFVPVLG